MPGTSFVAANWTGYDSASFTAASSVTNFTLVIDLSNLSASWKASVQSDGADIRVTKSDGTTELAYDLISWTYNAGSPTGFIRVLFSGASGTSANTVRVWSGYDGTAVAYDANETYGSDNAYDANWIGYWPLAGDINDRTANANHLTDPGGANSPTSGVSGVLTEAYDFDGGDYLYVDVAVDEPITLMGWYEPDTVTTDGVVISVADTAANDGFHQLYLDDTAGSQAIRLLTDARGNSGSSVFAAAAITPSVGVFAHYAGSVAASSASRRVNYNGGAATGTESTSTEPAGLDRICIGARAEGTAFSTNADGAICEAQAHAVERGAAWENEESSQTSDNASYWTTWSWTAIDATAPTLSSATIDSAGTALTLVFDESVTNATETDGWILRSFGGYRAISGGSGSGTDTHTITIAPSVLQNERVRLRYDSGTGSAQDAASNALADIDYFDVTNNSTQTVTRPSNPSYTGMPKLTGLTAITPKITTCFASGTTPFGLHVSAEQTTVNSGVTAWGSAACVPFRHLHFSWSFGEPGGAETFTDKYTGTSVNKNSSQIGPKAFYLYRNAGSFTVTLTAKGVNEYGQTVSASTTTVLTLGLYQYFDGGATGGTFTLTVDGQTTSAIAYNATTADIVAALESLSSVGSGNVRDTNYGPFEFVGSLAGQSLTISGDFSGLTGANAGDEAPDLIVRVAPSSDSTVTVSDLSTWTAAYFDSEAAGGGDGSEGTPYNDAATLRSFLSSDIDSSDNKVAYIVADSDFTLASQIKWGDGCSGRKIIATGTGAKPILRDAGLGTDLVRLLFAHITQDGLLEDFAIEGIHIISTEAAVPVYGTWAALGNTDLQKAMMGKITLVDNTFERAGGSSSLVRFGAQYEMIGVASYNNTYYGGRYDSLAHFNPNVAAWLCGVEDTYYGGGGDEVFFHHVYPKVAHESLWQNLTFGPAESHDEAVNFCINWNTGSVNSSRHVFDSCDAGGAQNGIDTSNVDNDADPFVEDVVIQRCLIHSNRVNDVALQENGYLGSSNSTTTIRYCDFWDNADSSISGDTTIAEWEIYHNNIYTHGGYGILLEATPDSYVFGNKIHTTGASANLSALRVYPNTVTYTDWEIDYNTYYAPGSAVAIYDMDSTAEITLAAWRATYGADANGAEGDPGFSDPDHGVMEYNFATPAFDTLVGTSASFVSRDAVTIAAYLQQHGMPEPQLDITPQHPGVTIDTSGISQPGIIANG